MDVKTLCLGVLKLGDATGYEIKKQFEEGPFAYFNQAGFGSIYPALNTLLNEGLVTCRDERQQGRPDKKIYRLTAAGEAELTAALHRRPAVDKLRSDSVFMLFFAEMLDEKHLRATYDGYLSYYRHCLDHLRSLDNTGVTPGRLFVRGMGATFYESMATYLEENRERFFAEIDSRQEDAGPAKTGTDR
ncbi:MAG: PadR family transcriptional regulator [Rhodospirillales bacterium]